MRTSPACNFQDKRKSDRPTTGQKAGYAPDRSTLLSATPSFQIGKNFENRQKHQRRRSARVGQADFGKLELNNMNHSGNCQRLFNLQLSRPNFQTFALLWTDEATTILRHFKVFSKTLNRQGLTRL